MVRLVLLRLFEAYFRHQWLYALPTALLSILGVLYIIYRSPVYAATGTMYVQKQSLLTSLTSGDGNGSWWITPSQATINEIKELLGTDAFVRSAIQKTDLESEMSGGQQKVRDTIDTFRRSVDLTAIGENLVMFGGRYKDPRIAQQMASALLETYLQWKINADNQESLVAQDFFAKLLQPYQQELDKANNELTAYLIAHPEPLRGERPPDEQIQVDHLKSTVIQAQARIASSMEKLENARLAQTKAESDVRQNYAIVDAPELPLRPATRRSQMVMMVALFMLAGMMLSFGGVIGGVVLNRSLWFPIDARHGLDLPVLAMVPDGSARARRYNPTLISLQIDLGPRRRRHALLNSPQHTPMLALQPTAVNEQAQRNGNLQLANDHIEVLVVAESDIVDITNDGVQQATRPSVTHHIVAPESDPGLLSIITLSFDQRESLLITAEDVTASRRRRTRAKILLYADERATDAEIVEALNVSQATVERTKQRFIAGGVEWALTERAHPGPRHTMRSPAE
jgi:uncharacterized protein involved in exopolysaccharide biosynthesis